MGRATARAKRRRPSRHRPTTLARLLRRLLTCTLNRPRASSAANPNPNPSRRVSSTRPPPRRRKRRIGTNAYHHRQPNPTRSSLPPHRLQISVLQHPNLNPRTRTRSVRPRRSSRSQRQCASSQCRSSRRGTSRRCYKRMPLRRGRWVCLSLYVLYGAIGARLRGKAPSSYTLTAHIIPCHRRYPSLVFALALALSCSSSVPFPQVTQACACFYVTHCYLLPPPLFFFLSPGVYVGCFRTNCLLLESRNLKLREKRMVSGGIDVWKADQT
ncbi:hypothetical protein EXIGLDRAFT_311825 [Exidia glandulosa HHB12029]|uniref:Uncharacterized protein n=1 Tax=Exidia glandulosa HHB12029 TaxID=1314781 RepID=A0A165CZK6_EXIGL|nr:hypothetical protein EXIGLDRAFT_311825 [Exidia glandulosa HHB12029]